MDGAPAWLAVGLVAGVPLGVFVGYFVVYSVDFARDIAYIGFSIGLASLIGFVIYMWAVRKTAKMAREIAFRYIPKGRIYPVMPELLSAHYRRSLKFMEVGGVAKREEEGR